MPVILGENTPSLGSEQKLKYSEPRVCVCMPALRVCVCFVYDPARVSEGEAIAHRLCGVCACMPVVCFSRASPSVVPLAMYVYP